MIDVTDTGKGIERKHHKTVFRPGFTTKQRGWGLGLSLAKRIIEEYHHGRIYVLRSAPDEGTGVSHRTAHQFAVDAEFIEIEQEQNRTL